MWLAYLRFDTARETRIAFVRCGNKAETDEVLRVGKGLFGAALTEYATFYSGRTIHAEQVPNFPEDLIFSCESFLRACGVTPGQPGQEGGTRPQHPPGSAGRPTADPAALNQGGRAAGPRPQSPKAPKVHRRPSYGVFGDIGGWRDGSRRPIAFALAGGH